MPSVPPPDATPVCSTFSDIHLVLYAFDEISEQLCSIIYLICRKTMDALNDDYGNKDLDEFICKEFVEFGH